MTQAEQQKAAKKFGEDWKDKGYEKGESQKFWLDLLCNVFGIKDFANFVYFENQIKEKFSDKTITNFIDVYIPSTKVMIEQKSIDKDLKAPIRQSDGSLLSPFQQARKYISGLPLSQHPRWVITCNFKSFLVYDMENPNGEPEEILLENLEKEFYRLSFIADEGSIHLKKELEISKKAGDIIGEIYDAILKQYKDADNPSPATLKSLNMLCVRIVFCLYAEDAGIFGHKSIFGDYLKQFEAKDLRRALLDLFQILDQKEEERDEYLEESLAAFPYVNGGLFTEEDKTIPPLTEEIKELLVKHASNEFDWSEISPTIFGAIFESTLNPETRRSGGMHYTSIENIHKVIDPLFLDDLKAEFEELKQIKNTTNRIEKVKEFHKRLGTLKFLDPACGSGNFLTETYLSLRKLGNECIKVELGITDNSLGLTYYAEDLIQVSIQQFYGIEINDFAAVVAKTALWIAESQMMKETAKIIEKDLKFLPLHTYANIIEGNALRVDWESVVPKKELSFILGNPPFVGAMWMKGKKREDVELVFPECEKVGEIDYVSGWYAKAAAYIQNTKIQCAFVSTNSICQGQQVALIWKPLFEKYNLQFNFAYRTFQWDSEANIKAHVHCIIIGFSCFDNKKQKIIYLNESQSIKATNINGYLTDADNVFITGSKEQISKMPIMHMGVMARDGGNLILSEEEYQEYIKKEPIGKQWIHRYMMGREFINNHKNENLIFVGGTGLYLKALLYDYKFEKEEPMPSDYLSDQTNEELFNKLFLIDKEDAIKIGKNNRKRLLRALYIFKIHGKTKSDLNSNGKEKLLYDDVYFIGLDIPREALYEKINKRVDKMISFGLEKEATDLFLEYGKDKRALQAIGYKEFNNNELSLEEKIDLIKKNTRNYAKRQMTFFKHQFSDIKWFNSINEALEYGKNIRCKN